MIDLMGISPQIIQEIKKQNYPAGKTKTLLAAIKLFSQQGFAATSTAQIADTAGVSQGTIFKYFKTKRDLLKAVITPVINNLIPQIQKDFLEHFQDRHFDNADDLAFAIVRDRYQFLMANQQLLLILIDQILTNQGLRDELVQNATTTPTENEHYDKIVHSFTPLLGAKAVNFQLYFRRMLRLLLGFFLEEYVIHGKLPEKEPTTELKIMAKQLIIAVREH